MGPHEALNLLAHWSWTSQLPKLWEINVCYLRLPVYGIFLYQPKLALSVITLTYASLRKTQVVFHNKANNNTNNRKHYLLEIHGLWQLGQPSRLTEVTVTAVYDSHMLTWRKGRPWGPWFLYHLPRRMSLCGSFCTGTLLSHSLTPRSSLSTGQNETIFHQPPMSSPYTEKPEQPLFQTARGALDSNFLIIHSRALWSCKSYYYSHNSQDY